MLNIRKALEEDKIFVVGGRIDAFVGERDFFDVKNDMLLEKKKEIEKKLNENYDNTKIVINDGEHVGSFTVYPFEDGVLLDNLTLIPEITDIKIKEFVIKYVISSNYGAIYTFIKNADKDDLEIYKALGFQEIETKDNIIKLKLNNF